MFWIYLAIFLLVVPALVAFLIGKRKDRKAHEQWVKDHAEWKRKKDAGGFRMGSYDSGWVSEPREPYTDAWSMVIPTFFISLMIAIFGCMFGAAYSYEQVKVPDVTYSDLATLNDGSGVHGSFFLGSGTIDSTAVFMYYTNDNGVYRLNHVDADYATVTYTDGPPRLLYHNTKSGNHFWALDGYGSDSTRYEFQVPAGSVKQSFNLDAK